MVNVFFGPQLEGPPGPPGPPVQLEVHPENRAHPGSRGTRETLDLGGAMV